MPLKWRSVFLFEKAEICINIKFPGSKKAIVTRVDVCSPAIFLYKVVVYIVNIKYDAILYVIN